MAYPVKRLKGWVGRLRPRGRYVDSVRQILRNISEHLAAFDA
jgi:hypothetical protein